MAERTAKELHEALTKPMPFKWRLKSVTNKAKKPYPAGNKGQFLAYIDARDVFNRLDEVVGMANWQSTVKRINEDGSAVVSLSIRVSDTEWIVREDVGYSNNPGEGVENEPLKAAVSDGVKRAAIHFGIGRFLYDMKAQWTPINQYGDPVRPLPGVAAVPSNHAESVDEETGEITAPPVSNDEIRRPARDVLNKAKPAQPAGNAERVAAAMQNEERSRAADALKALAIKLHVNRDVLGLYAVEKTKKPLEQCDAKELGRIITALQNETDVAGMIDFFTNRPSPNQAQLMASGDRTPAAFR